jgi:hypothetical protein
MSTGKGADQPTAIREWGYSRGWRRFSVIILRPLLTLPMKYRWQGKEYLPRTGGAILAPAMRSPDQRRPRKSRPRERPPSRP